MLVIRMQRTGRKGHAQFRVVVQDSRRTPTSGRVVAALGHYDPHTKTTQLNKEKLEFYLSNGAQPSDRVVRLLKSEGIKLPSWVKVATVKEGTTRTPDKLRKNRPAEEVAEEVVADEPVVETEQEVVAEQQEEAPAAETVETEEEPKEA